MFGARVYVYVEYVCVNRCLYIHIPMHIGFTFKTKKCKNIKCNHTCISRYTKIYICKSKQLYVKMTLIYMCIYVHVDKCRHGDIHAWMQTYIPACICTWT